MKNKLLFTLLFGSGIILLGGRTVLNFTQDLTVKNSDSPQYFSTQEFKEWKVSETPQRRPAECYDSGIC